MKKSPYVFNVQVNLITANRLAGEEEIKSLLGIDNIPATMKPLLRQEVIDRKVINPLVAIKKQVRDALLRYGSRVALLGWVIDPERLEILMQEIKHQEQRFNDSKAQLLSIYADSSANHVNKIKQECLSNNMDQQQTDLFCQVIRKAQPSLEYLKEQIRFEYLKPRKVMLDEVETQIVINGLYEQAIADIVAKGKDAMRSLKPVTKKRAVDEILSKLKGLQYLDSRIARLRERICTMCDMLPSTATPRKEWNEMETFALDGVISLLSDKDRLKNQLENQPITVDKMEAKQDSEDRTTPTGSEGFVIQSLSW